MKSNKNPNSNNKSSATDQSNNNTKTNSNLKDNKDNKENKEPWFPKSKRAVKANGGIVQSRGPREAAGGILVKEWQRLPKQLLSEYCQREKRSRPHYYPCSNNRAKVILFDPKGKQEKDIVLETVQSFNSSAEAEEYAALLALHHVTPTLPLEKKFPSPYAEAWTSLNTEKPSVENINKHVSKADKTQEQLERRTEINAKKQVRETREKAIPNVFMSENNRIFISELLQEIMQQDNATQSINNESSISLSKDQLTTISTELKRQGFSESAIQNGLKNTQSMLATVIPSQHTETVLDWLLLNLHENELPEKHNPKGKQLDIINFAGSKSNSLQNLTQSLELFLGVGRMCMPKQILINYINEHKNEGNNLDKIVTHIYDDLYRELISEYKATEISDNNQQADEIEEELTALESIFDSDFTRLDSTKSNFTDTAKYWSVGFDIPGRKHKITAEFIITDTCQYPANFPILVFRGEDLSSIERFVLLTASIQYIQSNSLLNSAMTYSLVDYLKTEGQSILASASSVKLPQVWKLSKSIATNNSENNQKNELQPIHETKEEKRQNRAFTQLNPKKLALLNEQLAREFAEKQQLSEYQSLQSVRAKLPMKSAEKDVIEAINNHQVVIIQGETGSGKTTQVPQIILDAQIHNLLGGATNIICTQPRRISAVGLAQRVAEERCERVGEMIGYRIRHENKVSNKTRLTFVTTGILIRQLTSVNINSDGDTSTDQLLQGVSHIIIDEVHERSVEIDFLLILMRSILKKRSDLKLILMSATIDTAIFANYFNNNSNSSNSNTIPILKVPGRTFPVESFYLEDVIEATNYFPDNRFRINLKADQRESALQKVKKSLNLQRNYSDSTLNNLITINQDKICIGLIDATVWYAIQYMKDNNLRGSILVFLPGLYEITGLINQIHRSIEDQQLNEKNFWIIPLHGQLSTSNQTKVFSEPPKHIQKIVVSTNIAETSITIPDCFIVIDSGKVRESGFDIEKKIETLDENWISKASAEQRKGRAGRVQKGICYRIYTAAKFQSFNNHTIPELHRTDLSHLCLQIKLISPNKSCEAILNSSIQPPSMNSIHSAVTELKLLNAFNSNEQLTSLGIHLASLPVHSVRIGKLLLFSALFGCLTPISYIAALLSGRSPYQLPTDKRDEAIEKHKKFGNPNRKSDHINLLKLFEQWVQARINHKSKQFCTENFVSEQILEAALKASESYNESLQDIGFVNLSTNLHNLNQNNDAVILSVLTAGLYPNVIKIKQPEATYAKGIHGATQLQSKAIQFKYFIAEQQIQLRLAEQHQYDLQQHVQKQQDTAENDEEDDKQATELDEKDEDKGNDSDSANEEVEEDDTKSIASTLSVSSNNSSSSSSTISNNNNTNPNPNSRHIQLHRVFVHPRSSLFSCNSYECPYLVYFQLVHSSIDKYYIYDCTQVSAYSLLLFGGELTTNLQRELIYIDGFVVFRAISRVLVLIKQLRAQFNMLLEQKIKNPKLVFSTQTQPVLQAIMRLITTNGF